MTRKPVLLQQEMATRMSHVPCFFLLSHQEDEDTQREKSWTTGRKLARDLWRMKVFRIKSFSVELWTKCISLGVTVPVGLFWSFSPGLHYLFCFSWNETQTKPACLSHCSADESLPHSMALSKQLAHWLSQLCLLKNRAMSYALLIMKKWIRMELFPESKLLNKYALTSDPKMRTCLWE